MNSGDVEYLYSDSMKTPHQRICLSNTNDIGDVRCREPLTQTVYCTAKMNSI